MLPEMRPPLLSRGSAHGGARELDGVATREIPDQFDMHSNGVAAFDALMSISARLFSLAPLFTATG